MNIKELLAKGLTEKEITEMFAKELNTEVTNKANEEKAKVKAEKMKAKRKETLADARAHLISAIGLYNEVFKFGNFTDEAAKTLADTLVECEEYLEENRDTIDMYVKFYKDKGDMLKNKKHICKLDPFDSFWNFL